MAFEFYVPVCASGRGGMVASSFPLSGEARPFGPPGCSAGSPLDREEAQGRAEQDRREEV